MKIQHDTLIEYMKLCSQESKSDERSWQTSIYGLFSMYITWIFELVLSVFSVDFLNCCLKKGEKNLRTFVSVEAPQKQKTTAFSN